MGEEKTKTIIKTVGVCERGLPRGRGEGTMHRRAAAVSGII